MKVFVDNEITIKDFTQETFDFFRNRLTFDNPDYISKQRMGKWVGNIPQKISLYQRHGTDLVIPFGELPIIISNKDKFGRIENNLKTSSEKYDYGSSIELYAYQKPAVQMAIKRRQGVIIAPCGAGKTQIGLAIASNIGRRTLWLTHTNELLLQSMNRAKLVFSLTEKDYGTITGGRIDLGNIMTFATVQTMSKIDLNQLKYYWDTIIVDECHHCVGTPTKLMMFYKVVSNLCARFKYGLTATPERADGLTPCMYSLIGSKIYEIQKNELKEKSCEVIVKPRWTIYKPKDISTILMPDGTLSYTKLLSEIISDEQRNSQIIADIEAAHGTCLVLTDRIAHMNILYQLLSDKDIKCMCLSGTGIKSLRKQALQDLTNGKIKVLIATFQLAKEGLDIPSLNNVFFATPQKNATTVTQSAGRVARAYCGKKNGFIYDYIDDFSMLQGWAKKRDAIYKKLDFKLEV